MERPEELRNAVARSEARQNPLGSHAEAIAAADRRSPMDALFFAALFELTEPHTKRLFVCQ